MTVAIWPACGVGGSFALLHSTRNAESGRGSKPSGTAGGAAAAGADAEAEEEVDWGVEAGSRRQEIKQIDRSTDSNIFFITSRLYCTGRAFHIDVFRSSSPRPISVGAFQAAESELHQRQVTERRRCHVHLRS